MKKIISDAITALVNALIISRLDTATSSIDCVQCQQVNLALVFPLHINQHFNR